MRGIRASWRDPARPGQSGRTWVHNVGLGDSPVWLGYGAAWPGLCMACPGYMAWPRLGMSWPGLAWICLAWLGYGVAWPGYGVAWLGYGVPCLGMVWSEIHGYAGRPHHTQAAHTIPRPGHAIYPGQARTTPGQARSRQGQARTRPGLGLPRPPKAPLRVLAVFVILRGVFAYSKMRVLAGFLRTCTARLSPNRVHLSPSLSPSLSPRPVSYTHLRAHET